MVSSRTKINRKIFLLDIDDEEFLKLFEDYLDLTQELYDEFEKYIIQDARRYREYDGIQWRNFDVTELFCEFLNNHCHDLGMKFMNHVIKMWGSDQIVEHNHDLQIEDARSIFRPFLYPYRQQEASPPAAWKIAYHYTAMMDFTKRSLVLGDDKISDIIMIQSGLKAIYEMDNLDSNLHQRLKCLIEKKYRYARA